MKTGNWATLGYFLRMVGAMIDMIDMAALKLTQVNCITLQNVQYV